MELLIVFDVNEKLGKGEVWWMVRIFNVLEVLDDFGENYLVKLVWDGEVI